MNAEYLKTLLLEFGLICLLLFSIAFECSAQDLPVANAPMRQWTSRDGKETVDASFGAYHRKTKIVSIVFEDGTSHAVALNKLSREDRKYVQKLVRDGVSQPTSHKKSGLDSATLKNRRKNAGTTRLFGIQWTPDMEVAFQSAAGDESNKDDRPVMWMRVLGELDGLM